VRAFTCNRCGQLVFFENSLCLRCATPLGFVPSALELVAMTRETVAAGALRRCANATVAGCNWMLEAGDSARLCRSCRLTRTRPGDSDAEGLAAFARAEAAKRRLLFGLFDLGLGVDEGGLAFDLLASRSAPVLTGHDNGVITIDLAESDDARREERRAELGEPYRTMLGHFRHEIGHYYWPLLIEGTGELERWRSLFGDERLDYEEALQRHYKAGPLPDWGDRHVSAYAAAHPWEDWAETFAHYLHIRDTLQTAAAFGLVVTGPRPPGDYSVLDAPGRDPSEKSIDAVIRDWLPLTYALNAVNRSMGRDDLYPFTLASTVIDKLAFVHDRVRTTSARGSHGSGPFLHMAMKETGGLAKNSWRRAL
jgi:hypothetical protein